MAGDVSDGAMCAHSITGATATLTFEQYLDFLEAKNGHGAAVCLSDADFGEMKTELESACRLLGWRCRISK